MRPRRALVSRLRPGNDVFVRVGRARFDPVTTALDSYSMTGRDKHDRDPFQASAQTKCFPREIAGALAVRSKLLAAQIKLPRHLEEVAVLRRKRPQSGCFGASKLLI